MSNSHPRTPALLELRPLQLASAVAVLLGIVYFYCDEKISVLDPDCWWHLKVGDWIVQHGAVPHTGVLTYTAADRPWAAYSWLYEVVLSRVNAMWGVVGIGWFGMALALTIALTLFYSLLRLSKRFWVACLLAAAACYGFLFSLMPRPFFISITLFTLVLTLVLEARRTENVKVLYPLPLLFLLWANVHIQFVYGLFLLVLLLFVEGGQTLLFRTRPAPEWLLPARLPLARTATVAGCSLLATCINPYGLHLYQVILEYSQSKFAYEVVLELQAADFRRPQNFAAMLLLCAAVAAVAWRRHVDLYAVLLLFVSAMAALRTTRDFWFLCIPAAACLAASLRDDDASAARGKLHPAEWLAMVAGTLVFALLIARNTGFDRRGMDAAMSEMFPRDAALFLQQRHLPGPLYNTLDWGGYLAYALPEYPVAIDGRNDLFGDAMDRGFYATQMGLRAPQEDLTLQQSRIVLLQSASPLASILETDPSFRLVYRDGLATVFLRR